MLADAILVTTEVGAALDRLGVRYVVGGSLATSIHGIPRAMQERTRHPVGEARAGRGVLRARAGAWRPGGRRRIVRYRPEFDAV
jgi:hypothetical protein